MALSVEKTWLMDYGVLRLVNRCRRLMEVEFGVKPPLHDPELPEMLAHYAGRTRQKGLQECYAELRMAVMKLDGEDDTAADTPEEKPTRMYRGQPLPDDAGDGAEEDAHEASDSGGRTVIYRGRVLRID